MCVCAENEHSEASVGKTCLLMTFCEDEFPEQYIPTVFENHVRVSGAQDVHPRAYEWFRSPTLSLTIMSMS